MAEIKIKEKKTIWPWVLIGLLILALLIYFLAFADDDDVDDVDDVTTEEVEGYDDDNMQNDENDDMDNESINSDDEIAAYSDYIGDSAKMGIDHEYSHGALTYLIDAVQAKASDLNIDVNSDLSEARESAKAIVTDPYEVNHADHIKESGLIITRALSQIQQQKYPDLQGDVDNVRTAAENIVKEQHTLNQKGDVNTFYKAAESLISKMK